MAIGARSQSARTYLERNIDEIIASGMVRVFFAFDFSLRLWFQHIRSILLYL
jgi:hypothetical protein